jgi:hypothetical protein
MVSSSHHDKHTEEKKRSGKADSSGKSSEPSKTSSDESKTDKVQSKSTPSQPKEKDSTKVEPTSDSSEIGEITVADGGVYELLLVREDINTILVDEGRRKLPPKGEQTICAHVGFRPTGDGKLLKIMTIKFLDLESQKYFTFQVDPDKYFNNQKSGEPKCNRRNHGIDADTLSVVIYSQLLKDRIRNILFG